MQREQLVLEIITASESNIPQIHEIWRELMDYHLELNPFYVMGDDSQSLFEKYVKTTIASEDFLALVAVEADTVLGYSIAQVSKHPPVFTLRTFVQINEMVVRSGHRGKGIGTLLLSRIDEWCKSLGIDRIELHVAERNRDGFSFWTKHGFGPYERILQKDL